jgi:hypothetical protein
MSPRAESFFSLAVSASYDTSASPSRGTLAAMARIFADAERVVEWTRLVEDASGFDRFDAERTTRRSADDAIDCMWGRGKPCVTRESVADDVDRGRRVQSPS